MSIEVAHRRHCQQVENWAAAIHGLGMYLARSYLIAAYSRVLSDVRNCVLRLV